MKLREDVGDILDGFHRLTENPEAFVNNEEGLTGNIQTSLKSCYDFAKVAEDVRKTCALPELIVEDFDTEQIWQQLELQNEEVLTRLLADVTRHVVGKDRLLFSETEETIEVSEDVASNLTDVSNESTAEEEGSEDEDEEEGSEEEEEEKEKETAEFIEKQETKSSVVDDAFFKLNEMERFLKAEEKKINGVSKQRKSTDDTDVDYDDDDDDDEEVNDIDLFDSGSHGDSDEEDERLHNPRYEDFFGSARHDQKLKQVEQGEEEEQEESVGDDDDREEDGLGSKMPELKSTLELREERLKARIESIEQMALSEKPWQLKGEITAENRPQNSLLEEIVEFDLTSRPAPVMTEQTTFQLEDVIRQRTKDRAFDSVVRKQKPVETPFEYKKKLVLNQEKNKESLAQIYEREYLQQKEALNPDSADKEKEEEEPEAHKEIRGAVHALFAKLDALSNFHFTPKMAAPELKIVSNLPAVNIEEVAPIATSDAALLAPEEVKPKIKGDELGKSERTETDKKRERRKKKRKQKRHVDETKRAEKLVAKLRPGLGNKYSKEKAKKMLEKATKSSNVDKMNEFGGSHKAVKSSAAFFKQLEEDVKSQIRGRTKQKRDDGKHGFSAKKMKL